MKYTPNKLEVIRDKETAQRLIDVLNVLNEFNEELESNFPNHKSDSNEL